MRGCVFHLKRYSSPCCTFMFHRAIVYEKKTAEKSSNGTGIELFFLFFSLKIP